MLALLGAATLKCTGSAPPQSQFVIEPARAPVATEGTAPLFTIDLVSAAERLRQVSTRRVKVDDPVYRQPKTYEGYRLSEVVDSLAPSRRSVSDEAHLVMVCLDGYRPALRMSVARSAGGILAVRDLEAASRWQDFPSTVTVRSPAPYYLVWTPAATSASPHLPWPYGVAAIEVWAGDPLNRAKPSETDVAAAKGYEVFAQSASPATG